ncbi:MAG: hypothetical protein R2753_11765 [Chitinophagales bacterium]
MFDKNGNLIGIITAKHAGAENASYAVKTSYLNSLIELLDDEPKLQTVSIMAKQDINTASEIVKNFVFIVEGR